MRERLARRKSSSLLTGMIMLALTAAACSSSKSSGSPSTPAGSSGGDPASSTVSVADSFVTATSSRSFSATVDALKHSVSSNGMMVMSSFDQAKALSMTGLHLPGAQSFFVGNPTTGKAFFQADPAAGAVLPVRMYVWQDQGGQVQVGYFDPGTLLSAIDAKLASDAKKISMMATKITEGATGAASTTAHSIATKFVVTSSSRSFSATVDALKHSVSSNGMMVMSSFDQAKALSMTGLHLPGAQSFFVGNPTTGKAFFAADPAAGMVVPVGMYVWQASSGATQVGYVDPGPLFAGLNPTLAAGGQKISMMATKITQGAS